MIGLYQLKYQIGSVNIGLDWLILVRIGSLMKKINQCLADIYLQNLTNITNI